MVATTASRVPDAAPAQPEAPRPQQSLDSLVDEVIARTEKAVGKIIMTDHGIEFDSFEGVQRYAKMLIAADCVPSAGKNADNSYEAKLARTTIAILLGRKVGLTPDQAVTSIYVVNNRPVLFGDAPLAVCRQHPLWDESGFDEWYEVNGKRVDGEPQPEEFKKETTAACCQTLRKGASRPKVSRFSMAHAKTAGLLGRNEALYSGYAQRMLRFRARGYCLRDNFGDALKGIGIRELAEDEPTQEPAKPAAPPVGRQSLKAANGSHPEPSAPVVEPPKAPESVQEPEPVNPTLDPAQAPDTIDLDAAALQDMVEHFDGRIDAAETGGELAKLIAEIDQAQWMGDEARAPLRAKVQSRQKELQPAAPPAPVATPSRRSPRF